MAQLRSVHSGGEEAQPDPRYETGTRRLELRGTFTEVGKAARPPGGYRLGTFAEFR